MVLLGLYVITAKKASVCLHVARRRGEGVNECWKTYRVKRRQVKKVIRKEKKIGRTSYRKSKNKEGQAANYPGQTCEGKRKAGGSQG